jgi:hypothetical protein
LRRVGDPASAVENVSAAYSDTTVAPHEYFDQTGNQSATPQPTFGLIRSTISPTSMRQIQFALKYNL